jgi:hypothetical protein
MTDITDTQRSDQPPWRLRLEEGDRLELEPPVGPIDDEEGDEAEAPDVVLRLRPWRAHDLSSVLDRYNRMVSIFDGVGEGIWREQSLARGLRDARGAATRRPATSADGPRTLGEAQRGTAMVVLQAARPELDHDQLAAVVDAAAWWLEKGEDVAATSLVSAVTDRTTAGHVHTTLVDRP